MAFDSLNFTSNAGKTIGSLATQSASAITSDLSGNFITGLSKTGLSLNGLKSLAAEKMDSLNSSLSGVAGFRITQQDLFKSRSSASSEPTTATDRSRKSQQITKEQFPSNLSKEYMQIEFSKYNRPSPLMPATFNTEYFVHLPLPRDLSETHSVRINPQDTGIMGAAFDQGKNIADEVSATLGSGKGKSSADQLENSVGIMYQGAAAVAGGLGGEQVAGIAGQFLKAVPNPHISVFFNGVDMRPPMEFSWLLSARNQAESSKIKDIIRQFKRRVLPAVSVSSQNVMAYPQMVRLTLFPWGEKFAENSDSNWSGTMPIYKLGLISAINVNYSPNGLSFFNDEASSPVFVVFSFTFQEIEVITGLDYGNTDAPTLGKDAINAAEDLGNSAMNLANNPEKKA